MSNTLNLGNGIWATKEDSLLAYNSESGNYKPLPFSFTRASSATVVNKAGLIETVQSGIPRIDFLGNTNGALLLEPQRTNSITNSETFGSTGWSDLNFGTANPNIVSDNYAISPDGTQNAQRIQFDLGGGTTASDRSIIRQSIASQSDWVLSVWMKSTNGTQQKVLWQVGADENETTVTGEWQRYTFDKNGIAVGFAGLSLRGGISTVDTADILVYGFQVEQSSYPTSYIPTQGSTVTRNLETCTGAGNDQVINSTEGVLYAEISALADDAGIRRWVSISDGTLTNYVGFYLDTGVIKILHNNRNSNPSFSMTITDFHKIALRWIGGVLDCYIDGTNVMNDTYTLDATGMNELNLSRYDNTKFFYGNTKDVRVYDTALTDAELISLTSL